MADAKAPTPWIVETSDATFEADVIDRSQSVPVVVDFWAPWCQPCQALGPILEKLAVEFDGRFVLVKANTENAPQAAGQFNVQSIPAVYGVRDGALADFFVGLLSEEQLRDWLERLLPSAAEVLAAEAAALEADDPRGALEKFAQSATLDPQLPAALIGRARLLLASGDFKSTAHILKVLEERGFLEPEAERVKAALLLQQQGAQAGGIDSCRTAVAQSPGDFSLQLRLAEALAAGEQYEEALELCLSIVEQDRHGVGEQAKERMVEIFRLLPEDSDLITNYRRRLSSALY